MPLRKAQPRGVVVVLDPFSFLNVIEDSRVLLFLVIALNIYHFRN